MVPMVSILWRFHCIHRYCIFTCTLHMLCMCKNLEKQHYNITCYLNIVVANLNAYCLHYSMSTTSSMLIQVYRSNDLYPLATLYHIHVHLHGLPLFSVHKT